MSELKNKAIKAASKFLDRRGYEVIEAEWKSEGDLSIDVIARDEDGTVVFCDVEARTSIEKGLPEMTGAGSRERREIAAAKWLAAHTEDDTLVDVSIRFDNIAMVLVGESRALLRHHINCFGCCDSASSTD